MSGGLSGFSRLAALNNMAPAADDQRQRMRLIAEIYITWGHERRRGYEIITNDVSSSGRPNASTSHILRFVDGTEIRYHVPYGEFDTFDTRQIETIQISGISVGQAVQEEMRRRERGEEMSSFVGGPLGGTLSRGNPSQGLRGVAQPAVLSAATGPTNEEWNTISVAMMHCLRVGRVYVIAADPASRPTMWLCQPLPDGECPRNSDGQTLPGYRVGQQTAALFTRLHQAVQSAAAAQAQDAAEKRKAAARVSVRRPIKRVIGEDE